MLKTNKMKTIAQQLNVKEFPFEIKDKNGNQIYFENSEGSWLKREFDSNGKEIYIEYSNGSWAKREFDSNGNEIYFLTSYGFWLKTEYDSNGNLIYYENSDGKVIDNRPKPSCEGKVIEVDGKKYKLTEV
jgi:hypothetical protein